MSYEQLNEEYFGWMCGLVCDFRHRMRTSYRNLLQHLHTIEFVYKNEMDSNRAEDGIDLRYRFAECHTYDWRLIAKCLDDKPCSVLEMMVALAIRCEEHIMDDPEIGERTSKWFWEMIDNLGLGNMTNSRFDERKIDEIVHRFLNREYKRNGEGGLFTVHDHKYNMRTAEIWWQLMWYLREAIDSRRI